MWRYPVKSMQGEELDEAAITGRGVLGDRAYAVLDRETGHIASAKHPGKWGALLACRAAFAEPPRPSAPLPPVWITLPDGAVISSAEPDVDRALSRALGRDVALVSRAPGSPTREADRSPVDGSTAPPTITTEPMALAAPADTFFDVAALHVLTTATLDRVRELHPSGRIEAPRFRPNLVVATAPGERSFVENAWLGRALEIDAEVHLEVIDPCPRCVVPTLPQGDLPRDPGILRALARHNAVASVTVAPGVVFPAVAGVYATVRREGVIRCGATVRLSSSPPHGSAGLNTR
ncbi:molybdenum cofactor biosysynthesis protein [Sorangium cellulosum]|uniref:Molybdenum cofactor biosysynthesis protein n=2 Tax=Sorangium cellulosum TaxID=56 RepID=A0A2L0EKL0_SORCE|nr:molybdenum cofactor biosysynthesis protein [Sorangium cellulosum]